MDVPSRPAIEFDNPLRIEDYGLIGDCTTAALVGRNGSVDWLCWPRFDSAALLLRFVGKLKSWPLVDRTLGPCVQERVVLSWRHNDTGGRFCSSGRDGGQIGGKLPRK